MATLSEADWTAAAHLAANKYLQLASVVMLMYDHIITLGDEIEHVWRRKWTLGRVLFTINRYLSALQLTVAVVAFNLPSWSENDAACDHFVRYLGAGTVALVGVAEIMLIMRVYALYSRDRRVLVFLLSVFALQIGVQAWVMSRSIRARLPPFLVGCILTGDNANSTLFWAIPLLLDVVVLILTLWKTMGVWQGGRSFFVRFFVRDGVIYFICIFAANCLNVIIFLSAPTDLKAMGATFSQAITSVMTSRLTLNLHTFRTPSAHFPTDIPESPVVDVTIPQFFIPSPSSPQDGSVLYPPSRRSSRHASWYRAMMHGETDRSTYRTFLTNIGEGGSSGSAFEVGSYQSTRTAISRPELFARPGCGLGMVDSECAGTAEAEGGVDVDVGADKYDIPLTPTNSDHSSILKKAGDVGDFPGPGPGRDERRQVRRPRFGGESIDSGYLNSGASAA